MEDRALHFSIAPLFILICTLGLLTLGILGIQRGDELAVSGAYAQRQFLWSVLGMCGFTMSALIPYRWLKGWSYPLYLLCVGLLVVVYFFPPRNGSRRWIPLGPLSVQPSELMKLAYILALGRYLMFRSNHRTVLGLIPPFLMTVIPVLLILKEPDLGTSLLFFPVLYSILFVAGAKVRHLVLIGIAGIVTMPVLWTQMSSEQRSRVTAVFTQEDGGAPKTGDGYHLHQSKQMLALGGLRGSAWEGMPLADPAAYRLPAGRTDFVYCLVGERWGLTGTLGVLFLLSWLVSTGFYAATCTRDPFGRLLATGIVSMLGVQGVINTAMTVGLAPITGLTLPLMSYGGSSLIITCISLGLVVNVALRPGYEIGDLPFHFADD